MKTTLLLYVFMYICAVACLWQSVIRGISSRCIEKRRRLIDMRAAFRHREHKLLASQEWRVSVQKRNNKNVVVLLSVKGPKCQPQTLFLRHYLNYELKLLRYEILSMILCQILCTLQYVTWVSSFVANFSLHLVITYDTNGFYVLLLKTKWTCTE